MNTNDNNTDTNTQTVDDGNAQVGGDTVKEEVVSPTLDEINASKKKTLLMMGGIYVIACGIVYGAGKLIWR